MAACILFAACEKNDDIPVPGKSGISLAFVKAISNGNSIVQNEFQYTADGNIQTRISYKDENAKLIGTKTTYDYENGRLKSTESQTDYSSSSSTVQYTYGRILYEYDNNNTLIQTRNFLKVNGEYKFTSFFTITYDDKKNPVKISRYVADGSLFSYSTYAYDAVGNVIAAQDYGIDSFGTPEIRSEQKYQYDNKKNPYKRAYHLLESMPYSVNENNITSTSSVSYAFNPQGDASSSNTAYTTYNAEGYPTSMQEQGNIFLLEYK